MLSIKMEEHHTKQSFGQYAATLSDSFKKSIMQIQKKIHHFTLKNLLTRQAKKAFVMAIRVLNRAEIDILLGFINYVGIPL